MIILGFKIESRGLPSDLKKQLGPIQKTVLRQTATFWYRTFFPRHFQSSNRARYAYAPRRKFYLDIIKRKLGQGQGKYVDLLLTGKSRRFMAGAQISGTKSRATVTLRPPGYFTNPFIGSFTDPRTGRMRHITRQPDKPSEVTKTAIDELREMRTFAGRRATRLMQQSGIRRIKIIRP